MTTAAEHAEEARRLLTEATSVTMSATELAGAVGAAGLLDAARDLVAAAQVHAILATVPDPLEVFTAELVSEAADHIGIGSRVVWLQARPNRPGLLVFATDVLGTVTDMHLQVQMLPRERVTCSVVWDDGIVSTPEENGPVPLDELRVVRGV